MAKTNITGHKRDVSCTYCGREIEISTRAMSVFCPHCQKRVVCENYTIKSYHAVRNIATCGDVIIEKRGHVVAPIRAESLIIRGLVRGNIIARNRVEIESTGVVQGNVEARRLIMRDGAKLMGACKISRNGAPPKPQPPSASAAQPSGRTPTNIRQATRPAAPKPKGASTTTNTPT
ncbi:MAG: polymer-forming cytoskeletal protein [Phycisphaerae bacterium]|nr:polymer-forming cytoskeletal protein [Phycisphaerae bacterium]